MIKEIQIDPGGRTLSLYVEWIPDYGQPLVLRKRLASRKFKHLLKSLYKNVNPYLIWHGETPRVTIESFIFGSVKQGALRVTLRGSYIDTPHYLLLRLCERPTRRKHFHLLNPKLCYKLRELYIECSKLLEKEYLCKC